MKQFEVYTANLNPRLGIEAGKIRPVVIVQTNLLAGHPSTIICPITSKLTTKAHILRVFLPKGEAGMEKDSDIMVDQVRAIDNARLLIRLGNLSPEKASTLKKNLRIMMDL